MRTIGGTMHKTNMNKEKLMFQIERHEKILSYINKNKKVSTRELSEAFGMSVVTIRADINALADRGLIVKSHGGALSLQSLMSFEIPSAKKFQQNVESKQKIAALAVDLIHDDDVIILDAGSTTLEIAKRIHSKPVTVITNDLKVSVTLAEKPNVHLLVTGGQLIPSVYTLAGANTIEYFSRIKVNRLFMGCDALDFKWGISNRTMEEIAVKQAMMRASNEIIVVSDHSKFDQQVFAHLCDLNEFHTLVTDQIPSDKREILENLGISVITPADGKHIKPKS